MSTFFAAMWPTFFIRVSPASRKAKPACMNITSTAARTTQIVLAAIARSALLIARPPRGGLPVRLCVTLSTRVVQTIPSPETCRCGRRRRSRHDRVGLLVLDDEDEVRLRQEARLEDAPAVLVRDPRWRPWPTASTTVTPTWPVCSSTASMTVSTRSRTTTASTLITDSSIGARGARRRARCRRAGRCARGGRPRGSRTRRCSARLARFSGKTPAWSVQIPRPRSPTSASSSAWPTPWPRAASPT